MTEQQRLVDLLERAHAELDRRGVPRFRFEWGGDRRSKLTAEQRRACLVAVGHGTQRRELAKRYGVAPSTISRAVRQAMREVG